MLNNISFTLNYHIFRLSNDGYIISLWSRKKELLNSVNFHEFTIQPLFPQLLKLRSNCEDLSSI